MNLLAKTNHFKLKDDANCCLRDFAKHLTERVVVTDELMHAFYELLFVLNHSPERLKIREILVEKCLIEKPSALATMYESKKIAADPRESRHGYGCTYTHNSDEADDYGDAVEDSNLVDLEAGLIGRSSNSCPAAFI